MIVGCFEIVMKLEIIAILFLASHLGKVRRRRPKASTSLSVTTHGRARKPGCNGKPREH